MSNLTSPCKNCPFAKSTEPGKLGGSPPETYLGQSCGPFFLPCHAGHDYTNPQARRNPSNQQCAGAAIFRANIGASKIMPNGILQLQPDYGEKVFATPAEFLAHHTGLLLYQAEIMLSMIPLTVLRDRELAKPQVTTIKELSGK